MGQTRGDDENTVAVTGAGGFIASHLVERLVADGVRVRALVRYDSRGSLGWLDALSEPVRSQIQIVRGDIRDQSIVKQLVAGVRKVVHLAALIGIPYSYQAPDSYVQTNVVGTLNVLESCRASRIERVVQISTSEVYGTARYVPIDESHPIQPQSPYAASKASADHLALSFYAAYGTPVVVIRPFNTFGPRQSLRAIIPTIAGQLLRERPVRLGALTPTRDFTFVQDTVDGLVRALGVSGIEGRTIQLGSGSEISVGDLAVRIAEIVGVPLKIEFDRQRVRPAASEVERLVSDPSLAKSMLGWRAEVGLSEGLHRTIQWLRDSPMVSLSSEYNE